MTITVGTTNITFPDSSVQSTTSQAFKNVIINGAMNVIQGPSPSITNTPNAAITYSARFGDHYIIQVVPTSGTAAMDASFVASTGPYKKALRVSNGTGMTSGGTLSVIQRIEARNTYNLTNTASTLSLQAYISCSNATSVTWAVYKPSSTASTVPNTWSTPGGSVNAITSGSTLLTSGTFTVSSTPAVYTASFSLAAQAAESGLMVAFSVATTASGQSMDITGIQLEQAPAATAFDWRPYNVELMLCQRYKYVIGYADGAYLAGPQIGFGYGTSSLIYYSVMFPTKMYSDPSTTFVGSPLEYLTNGSTSINATGRGVTTTGQYGGVLYASMIAPGFGTGTAGRVYWNSGAQSGGGTTANAGYYQFLAEF